MIWATTTARSASLRRAYRRPLAPVISAAISPVGMSGRAAAILEMARLVKTEPETESERMMPRTWPVFFSVCFCFARAGQ
jgi:hypothetical protein